MTKACNFCGQSATSCCSRCKTGYCSRSHQKLDWRAHKSVCVAAAMTPEPAQIQPSEAQQQQPNEPNEANQPNETAQQQPSPAQIVDPFVDRVCVVCFSDIQSLERESCPTHPACAHCLKTWMKECIDTRRIPDMPCVDSTCKFTQPFSLLESLHGTAVVQKYLDRCAFKCASTLGKFLTCPQCPHLFLVENGTEMNCATLKCRCGVEFCMSCNRRAHPGKCEEFAMTKDEQATSDFINIYTKPCVSCNWPIQKNGGCHQMTCSQCKKVFCWICSKDVSGDHSVCSSKLAEEAAKIDSQLAQLKRSTDSEIKKRTDLESIFEKRIEGASKQLVYMKHKLSTSQKSQQQQQQQQQPQSQQQSQPEPTTAESSS